MRHEEPEHSGLAAAIRRNPMDVIGAALATAGAALIVINALYLQPGPHPAPIFSLKPAARVTDTRSSTAPVLPRPRPPEAGARVPAPPVRTRTEIIADIQKELLRRNFFEGPIDGVMGPKTDSAIRDFEQAASIRATGEPSEELLRVIARSNLKGSATGATASVSRPDPLGELIAPNPRRVMAVQRALSDYGYAQIKPSGIVTAETKAAIERFERDRKLPVTGLVSGRLVRELAAMTGRPLE